MYNILYNIRFNQVRHGGVAHYMKMLTAHIDRSRFSIWDLTAEENPVITSMRHTTFWSVWQRRLCSLWDRLLVNRVFKKRPVDLIQLNPSLGTMALVRDMLFAQAAQKAEVPFVVFFRGWNKDYQQYLESKPRKLRKFKECFKNAARILVLSQDFKRKLVQWGFEDDKIIVETTLVDDALLDGFNVQNKINLNKEDKFQILFLSRIEKTKGIYEALNAYALIKEKYPFVSLKIAGIGSELDNAKNYVAEKGIQDVQFTGWVQGDAKKEAFAGADAYLFPSYTEGMPNSVLEAMALGLPVITRPVGGLKDFFEHGKMGFMTESKDPEVYAGFIKKLIENPELRKDIARYNHDYARERFLASNVARRMEGIYEKVISPRIARINTD